MLTLHKYKHAFTVAQGNQKMLLFMDYNPAMSGYPVFYTNDPCVIVQNDNIISINSISGVDLLGQCNAEFLAGHQFSGTGGQLDFVRGAFDSKGASPFWPYTPRPRRARSHASCLVWKKAP